MLTKMSLNIDSTQHLWVPNATGLYVAKVRIKINVRLIYFI